MTACLRRQPNASAHEGTFHREESKRQRNYSPLALLSKVFVAAYDSVIKVVTSACNSTESFKVELGSKARKSWDPIVFEHQFCGDGKKKICLCGATAPVDGVLLLQSSLDNCSNSSQISEAKQQNQSDRSGQSGKSYSKSSSSEVSPFLCDFSPILTTEPAGVVFSPTGLLKQPIHNELESISEGIAGECSSSCKSNSKSDQGSELFDSTYHLPVRYQQRCPKLEAISIHPEDKYESQNDCSYEMFLKGSTLPKRNYQHFQELSQKDLIYIFNIPTLKKEERRILQDKSQKNNKQISNVESPLPAQNNNSVVVSPQQSQLQGAINKSHNHDGIKSSPNQNNLGNTDNSVKSHPQNQNCALQPIKAYIQTDQTNKQTDSYSSNLTERNKQIEENKVLGPSSEGNHTSPPIFNSKTSSTQVMPANPPVPPSFNPFLSNAPLPPINLLELVKIQQTKQAEIFKPTQSLTIVNQPIFTQKQFDAVSTASTVKQGWLSHQNSPARRQENMIPPSDQRNWLACFPVTVNNLYKKSPELSIGSSNNGVSVPEHFQSPVQFNSFLPQTSLFNQPSSRVSDLNQRRVQRRKAGRDERVH